MLNTILRTAQVLLLALAPVGVSIAADAEPHLKNFTQDGAGLIALVLFAVAYLLVAGEEPLSLKKSKPMLVAAALIWVCVAVAYIRAGDTHTAEYLFRENIEHYTELFLFLLAAMTYVNAMSERGLFRGLAQWLISQSYSLRKIFWVTGLLSFVLSPFVANLAVALLMVTVLMAVAPKNRRFIVAGSINIVVAANAGGAISPFGDITTLMVWQRGLVDYHEFFTLSAPALVNWLIPAVALAFSLPKTLPDVEWQDTEILEGAWVVVVLFVITLLAAVYFESVLHLPATIAMMTGLGLLKLYGYQLKRKGISHISSNASPGQKTQFDIFRSLERSEWDTLMFLMGIVLSVGGLAAMGYLAVTSDILYGQLGATSTNILIGILSAFVENVPVMYAVLGMQPAMDHTQWLLVTLTAGVGGSLLSIGSVAGVAVMGQAQGIYTFMSHLRWTWVIAIGYVVSIWVHLLLNNTVA